jgi:predicted DsbA family dithiol-disulfide isomerase
VRIEELKKQFRIEVHWRAFPLHPETPEQGFTLQELFAGRDIDIPSVMARLRSAADELGLDWGDREKTFNSRLAQELGKWAEVKGKGNQFHMAVFRAYFAEGKNIALVEELSEIASTVGLPRKEAQKVIGGRSFKESVDADWKLSREWGITAVPTFVIDQKGLVGARPYKELEEFLRKNEVAERKAKTLRGM